LATGGLGTTPGDAGLSETAVRSTTRLPESKIAKDSKDRIVIVPSIERLPRISERRPGGRVQE
jgi:hypothetical protein